MQTPSDTAHQMLLERYAERKALEVCRSATFLKCLKDYGVAPTTTVNSPKGVSILGVTACFYHPSSVNGSEVC